MSLSSPFVLIQSTSFFKKRKKEIFLFSILMIFGASLRAEEKNTSQAAVSTNAVSAVSTNAVSAASAQNNRFQMESTTDEDASVRNFKPWQEGSNALGDWGGWKTKLAEKGIELGLSSINEVWGNTVGGLKRGAVSPGLIQLATAIDLEKLAHWKGAKFYSRWACLTGNDPGTTLTADFFGVSNIAGLNTFRNIELWGEQNFWDDKISLRVGQIVADSEFIISDYAALFINNTFGWPSFIFTNIVGGGPGYPVGVPGLRLKFQPTESFSLKAAVFEGVYTQSINSHGFYWDFSQQSECFYIGEADYRYKYSNLPGQVKTGVWGNSGNAINATTSSGSLSGNYGIYGIIDQMIYRQPTMSDKKEADDKKALPSEGDCGLGTFARIAFEPASLNLTTFYFDTGFNYKGLIPKRESDILGMAISYGQLSSNGINTIQQSQGFGPASSDIVFETTYQAQITPFLSIQPDMQYIIHPGTVQNLPNAFVIGIRASITF